MRELTIIVVVLCSGVFQAVELARIKRCDGDPSWENEPTTNNPVPLPESVTYDPVPLPEPITHEPVPLPEPLDPWEVDITTEDWWEDNNWSTDDWEDWSTDDWEDNNWPTDWTTEDWDNNNWSTDSWIDEDYPHTKPELIDHSGATYPEEGFYPTPIWWGNVGNMS